MMQDIFANVSVARWCEHDKSVMKYDYINQKLLFDSAKMLLRSLINE